VNILEEAESIIYGDREQTYGKPGVNLERIAGQWALYLQQKFGVEVSLTAEDVCWMMVDLKKCRQMNADKRDNLVDAAGYLALIERAADGSKESESNSKVDPLVALCLREKTASAREQQALGAVVDGGLESFNEPDEMDKVIDDFARKRTKQLAGPPSFAKPAPAPVEPNKDPKVCDTFWPVEANSPWCRRCGYSRQKHSQHAVKHGVAYGGNTTAPVFPQPLNPEDNK